jgi:hypothetical protein
MLNVKIIELLVKVAQKSRTPDLVWKNHLGKFSLALKNGYTVEIQCFQFGDEDPAYEFTLKAKDVDFQVLEHSASMDYLILRALYWAASQNVKDRTKDEFLTTPKEEFHDALEIAARDFDTTWPEYKLKLLELGLL